MAIFDVAEQIDDKNIVIFGTGEVAKTFYDRNKDNINIKYFTSNWNQEIAFCGLQRIEPTNLQDIEDVYIVVCASKIGSSVIENQLSLQFSYITQFCDHEIFEQMLQGKRRLLLVTGLCHQQLLFEGLQFVRDIVQEYILSFYWYGDIKSNVLLKKKVFELSKHADFAVVLKTRANECYHYISPIPKKIIFPNPCLQAIYPQIIWGQGVGNTYLENPVLKQKMRKRIEDIRAFRYTDRNVVQLVQQGFSDEEVVKEISRRDFYTKDVLSCEFDKMIRYNRNADSETDIMFTDYIIENYTEHRLFLDGEHFSNQLAWKIIVDTVKIIDGNINISEEEKLDLIHKLTQKDAVWEYECPVYPSVQEYFGLQWVNKNTKYKYVNLYSTRELEFEEFMLQYTSYIRCALNLKNCWKGSGCEL